MTTSPLPFPTLWRDSQYQSEIDTSRTAALGPPTTFNSSLIAEVFEIIMTKVYQVTISDWPLLFIVLVVIHTLYNIHRAPPSARSLNIRETKIDIVHLASTCLLFILSWIVIVFWVSMRFYLMPFSGLLWVPYAYALPGPRPCVTGHVYMQWYINYLALFVGILGVTTAVREARSVSDGMRNRVCISAQCTR